MTSKLPLRPLHDRVFVRRVEPPKKTAGGIIIPATAKDRNETFHGEVLAVGPGFLMDNGKTRYSDCKVGDHVLFSQFGKTRLTFEDKPLLALRYEHVHAIVDDPSLFGANIERAVGDEDFKR